MKITIFFLLTTTCVLLQAQTHETSYVFEKSEKLIAMTAFPEDHFKELTDLDTLKRQETRRVRQWVDTENDSGTVRLRVFPIENKRITNYLTDVSRFQQYTCAQHDQEILSQTDDELSLFTQCIMAFDQEINTLHKVLEGRYALYIFERIFNKNMQPEQLDLWHQFLRRLEICNNNIAYCRQMPSL